MQQIQDRRGLRDMAETVAGDGNNEVGHVFESDKFIEGLWPLSEPYMPYLIEDKKS